MSYTGTEIFERAIVVIDELSGTGLVNDTQVAEHKYRAPLLLDLWQKEHAKKGSLFTTIEIVRKPLANLLGDRFDIVEHFAEDLSYESSEVARSFCLKVDNECSVYIEEYVGGAWANASGTYIQGSGAVTAFTGLITVSALTNPARVKGLITATGTKMRIRFAGSYYYQFNNFALYKASFPTCARVPDYAEYIKCDMPSDFDSITQITEESPKSGLFHRWENTKDLYVNHNYEGVLKITYKPAPVKVTVLTQTLEVNESAAISGAYYLAEHFAMADQNELLAQRCRSKYAELKSEDAKERPLDPQPIVDVYGL